MIDTIQFTPSIPIPVDLDLLNSFQLRFPKKQGGERFTETSKYIYRTRTWNFAMIGLRLESTGHSSITKIECDLPKLLYGHNGRLIHNQAELSEAIRRIGALLHHFTLWPAGSDGSSHPIDLGPVSRIDLVWQYNIPVTTIRNLLQNCRVEGINKNPSIHDGKNIVIPGTYLGVKAYDKIHECGGKASPSSATNACRFEFRLVEVERIAKAFGLKPGEQLKFPEFDQSYSVYRTLMGRIDNVTPAASAGAGAGGIARFLAEEAIKDPWIISRYLESRLLRSSSASRVRQRVRAVAKKLRQFDLRSLIPPGQPPAAVDVVCSSKEKIFQDFLTQNPDLF
jgi:hypothetical protein